MRSSGTERLRTLFPLGKQPLGEIQPALDVVQLRPLLSQFGDLGAQLGYLVAQLLERGRVGTGQVALHHLGCKRAPRVRARDALGNGGDDDQSANGGCGDSDDLNDVIGKN